MESKVKIHNAIHKSILTTELLLLYYTYDVNHFLNNSFCTYSCGVFGTTTRVLNIPYLLNDNTTFDANTLYIKVKLLSCIIICFTSAN